MLGTDTHEATHIIQIVLEDIVAEDCGETRGRPQHTSQHGDHRSLTRTIMAEQGKDLTFIHTDINSIHSLEAIVESLA